MVARDSAFHCFLSDSLGAWAECQPQGRVFHWEGTNSERARRRAGAELAAWLVDYERAGRPYHLVGHSHGGSVVWYALREVSRRVGTLRALRSWVTVGTPFFRYTVNRSVRWLWFSLTAALVAGGVLAIELLSVDEAEWRQLVRSSELAVRLVVPVLTIFVRLAPRAHPARCLVHDRQDGNGDAHLKAGLVGPSETIPVIEGAPGLSTWQGVFFCEFDGPRSDRSVSVTVLADW